MRKFLIFLNLIVILSLMLAACGSTPTTAPAEPTKTESVEVEAPEPEEPAAPEVEEPEATEAEKPTDVPEPEATEAPAPEEPEMAMESPMLAEMVAAGELPPLEERIPSNPRVIKALTDEVGEYGGEMRVGFVGTSPEWGAFLFLAAWEGLVQWTADFNGYEYNLAESIDVSDDVTEYTIHLREGLKWSDGAPYNADDIMFYIEDVLQDPDLSPDGAIADWLPSDMKDDFKAEKIDDTTVKLIFPKPYGTFLYNLAGWQGRYFTMYPKHYLQEFHASYNEDIDSLVEAEESVTDWMGLFFLKGPDNWANPARLYDNTDTPSMYPWITVQTLGAGTQIRLDRNPYYWKVDEQGRQLPYIDKLLGISYQDNESRTLAMLNGELDYIKDPGNENRVLFHDAVDEGKPIQIKYPNSDGANVCSIHFNQTVEDADRAAIFGSKDFRIGMSYAINRPEVIEIVFSGQGEPAQVAPLSDSAFYIEGMDTQYTEYDVDLANEYLDKVLPEKDANGMRLGPDGQPFEFVFVVQNDLGFGTQYVQITELLIGYWEDVGVKVTLNSIAGEQYDENKKQNLIEATIYTGEGGAGITPILDPRYYVPLMGSGVFSQAWSVWRVPDPTGTSVEIEPPQWAKDAYDKYENGVLTQPTYELQVEKMREVLEEAKERFYVIGISRPGSMYYPFNTSLGGIPDTWFDGWNEGATKIQFPEQWFLKQ